MLNKILFLFFLLPFQLFAQTALDPATDITGLWKGSLYNDTTKKNLTYQIAISEEKGKLVGYSYTLFEIDGKKEMGVKSIKIKRKDNQLTIEDESLIFNNYSEPPPRKVRQFSVVNLSVNDTAMQLIGNWSTNRTKEYSALTGTLQLQRAIDYRPLALYKKLQDLNLDQQLSFVKADNKRDADLAKKDKPAAESFSTIHTPSQSGYVDKSKETIAARPDKKSTENIAIKEEAKKENAPEQPTVKISVTEKSKAVIVPVTEKKKEVIPSTNIPQKVNIQPIAKKPTPITPEPVTAVKEPSKKEIKPATETVKKPVNTEKPTVVIVPEVNKKTVQVPAVVNEPVKKEAPVLVAVPNTPKAAANVSERKMNKEQSVFFESDSLLLTLYDNGDVDGDTVSVLMNGQIIFANQGLSTKANSKTIYTGKGMPDSLSLVMYAENLGSIPPNTGLLVIMDGEKRYEVRFSADLKTNAAILLKRLKIEK